MAESKNELVLSIPDEKYLPIQTEKCAPGIIPDIVYSIISAPDAAYQQESATIKELLTDKSLPSEVQLELIKSLKQSSDSVRHMKIGIAFIAMVLCPIAVGIGKRISR